MAKKRADQPSEAMYIYTKVFWLIHEAMKWGTIAFGLGTLAHIVDALAGHYTVADIKVIGSMLISDGTSMIPWQIATVALSLTIYGILKIKGRTIERLGKQVRDLEKIIDINRTSSGLLDSGETNPGDKLL